MPHVQKRVENNIRKQKNYIRHIHINRIAHRTVLSRYYSSHTRLFVDVCKAS